MFILVPGLLAIISVETTISRNHIDLSAAPMTSTGPLNQFLGGIFDLVVVFWCGIRDGVDDWPVVAVWKDRSYCHPYKYVQRLAIDNLIIFVHKGYSRIPFQSGT